MVIIWVTPIMVTPTTMVTMERGAPRLSQLPRLMPKLPQRLTPGCTTAMLGTDSTHTVMVIMVGYAAYAGYHPFAYYGGGCR